jgi:hypothetical protein
VSITRRTLVARAGVFAGAIAGMHLLRPARLWSQNQQQRPDPLASDLVRNFVVAAHGDIEKTKSMLAVEPRLVNATWDWGRGDFETALGGASHTGRADIATLLLAGGARMDVFCAAMMGKTEIVKACLADTPSIINVKGPHGISLLRHAKAGKQDALVELLTAAGAT